MTESRSDSPDAARTLQSRISRLVEVMAALITGNYDVSVEVGASDDDLSQIEHSVNFLAEQLTYERTENERQRAEVQEKLDIIKQQQEAIFELSVPSIKVWEGVLVVPVIGFLDTRRSSLLTEALLQDVIKSQSRVVIIDLTGVPVVDSSVASHLVKTIESVKLLGADCVIAGIRPEVARTVVALGIDLPTIQTYSNLAEALKGVGVASD